jgi:PAS domain S-box-containing protein
MAQSVGHPHDPAGLRALEQHLAALVASSEDAIIGKTLDGIILSWNAAAEQLYGYRAAEVIGRSIAIIIPPDRPDELVAILTRLARGERIEHYETVRRHKDGSLIDVSVTISPIRDGTGVIVGASAIARDIRARRRLERQLHEREAQLRFILEAVQVGTWDWDIETGTVQWSDNLESIHGMPPGSFDGTFDGFLALVHPDDRPSVTEAINRASADGADYDIEFRVQPPDGPVRWIAGRGRVLRDADGTPRRMVGIGHDITARKQTEADLRESEERLQLAARVAGFGMYDERGVGQVYWSPELKALFGLPPDVQPDDGARLALTFIHPDDRVRWRQALEAARDPSGTGEMEVEHRVLRPDGSTVWVAQKGRILFEGHGTERRPVRAIGVVANVTARREAEAALAASREQLGAILASAADGITVQGPDGRLLYANDAAARLVGFPSVAALLAASRDRILAAFRISDEQGNPVAPEQLPGRRAAVTRAPAEIVLQYDILATGEHRWSSVRAVPVLDQQGAVRFTVTAFQDITALKYAEQTLAASERRYRELWEHSTDVLFTLDSTGRLTDVNRKAEELLGYTRSELVALPLYELVPPEYHALMQQMVTRKAEGEPRTSYEIEVLTKDGRRLPLEISSRVLERDGEVLGIQGSGRDITERRRAEAQLQETAAARDRALREAQEALRVRDEFLSSVSHDLRTPLGSIKGLAQLLARQIGRLDIPQAPRLTDQLAGIDRATNKMAAMVDELLDLARLEAGQPLELTRTTVDLVTLAHQYAEEQRRTAPQHEIRVEAAVARLVGVWDQARLERVLANLLSNAVKYSPAGSTVVVRVGTVGAERPWAELEVEDHGVGIPAADLPHIFERFHRGANVTGQIGAGIGLAGVKRIIELHGGTIAVVSAEGVGTTVTVRLPLADPDELPREAGT